jgi:hypothetical protein
MRVNLSRGFFRLWIAVSAVWVAAMLVIGAGDADDLGFVFGPPAAFGVVLGW